MCSELQSAVAALADWGIGIEKSLRHTRLAVVDRHVGGAGGALVLVNGFGASGSVWPRAWVRDLEQRFRVVRIDNRGTGGSRGAPTPFTIADLADDVVAVLDARGIATATVLGMSMGGMIAQEVAGRHPERVQGLLLVSTIASGPGFVPTTPVRALIRAIPQGARGRATAAERLARFYLGTCSPHCRSDGFVDELAAQLRAAPTSAAGVLAQARAIAAWQGASPSGTAPTTVVAGADDPIVKVRNVEALAGRIPGVRTVVLDGVGHLVPWEAPHVLLDLLNH